MAPACGIIIGDYFTIGSLKEFLVILFAIVHKM